MDIEIKNKADEKTRSQKKVRCYFHRLWKPLGTLYENSNGSRE